MHLPPPEPARICGVSLQMVERFGFGSDALAHLHNRMRVLDICDWRSV
jgi:hypothetical protein